MSIKKKAIQFLLILLFPTLAISQNIFLHPACIDNKPENCTKKEIKKYLSNYLEKAAVYEVDFDTIKTKMTLSVDDSGFINLESLVLVKGSSQQEKALREAIDSYAYGMTMTVYKKKKKRPIESRIFQFQFVNPAIHRQNMNPDEVYKVVEEMPLFYGCEPYIENCTKEKILDFIDHHLIYPDKAVEIRKEGTVVVRFIVEKDGSVSNAEIVREIGSGCGDEGLRIVNLMNELGYSWTCGKHLGVPVRVFFNLPIKFKLKQ